MCFVDIFRMIEQEDRRTILRKYLSVGRHSSSSILLKVTAKYRGETHSKLLEATQIPCRPINLNYIIITHASNSL